MRAAAWRTWRRLGGEQRVAVGWFLAFAVVAGFYALLLPVLDDWRSSRRAMRADCRVTAVIDGDTVELACPGRGRHGGLHRARLVGYDAPELSEPRCTGERVAAEAARISLRGHVAAAREIEVAVLGQDRYRRLLLDMRLDGRRVAALMVAKGHGRRYFGRARGGWC